MKSLRKEGGNEEDWTVEGFGNCTKSPAAELKPAVRFNDDENSPSLSGGRLSDKISAETSSAEEDRSNRSNRSNASNAKQSSRLQSEKERAR